MKKIVLLAGEESGLLYAERLKRELPGCEFRMYQDFFKTSDLAVMGFWPVIKRIFFFLGVQRKMKEIIRDWKPDAVVTIDYPGLNLKLAAYAKSLGIPAVHIVCPQVWAWHQNRIPKVAAAVNRLLCFFPFEPALFKGYESDKFKAVFIGHPMVDVFAEEQGQERKQPKGQMSHAEAQRRGGEKEEERKKIVAVLPGSRVGEIRRILPRLVQAIQLLDDVEGLKVVIPAANDRAQREIARILSSFTFHPSPFTVQRGGARDLLRRADCAAVASGTATLEAALAHCPTVLVYAVSPLLAWFARKVITGVKHIGLANVIAEKSGVEPPMPELLQEAFTPEAVAARLRAWLGDESARARASQALDAVMARLHSDGNALALAAREVEELKS